MKTDIKKNFATVTVLGIILVAIGIISPIIWDIYKGKTELTLSCLGSSPIVERKEEVQELRVLYGNKPVESVTRISFSLKNTGRRPIVKEVVRTPVRINFQGNILKQVIEHMFPDKGEYIINNIDEKTLEIAFDLMNPGDFITLTVLLDSSDTDFDASARIVGIDKLKILKATQTDKKGNVFDRLGITDFIVLSFSIAALLLVIFLAIPEAYYDSKLKSNVSGAIILLKPQTSKQEIISYLSFLFFSKIPSDQNKVSEMLKDFKDDDILDSDTLNEIRREVTNIANDSATAKGVTLVFSLLVIIGFGYVIWKLIMG